jgi:hypothetical protein
MALWLSVKRLFAALEIVIPAVIYRRRRVAGTAGFGAETDISLLFVIYCYSS